jgi:hypothetical protein
MGFNWVRHEFQLGTNYGLPVARPTDVVAEANRIGEDVAGKRADDRPRRGNAQSLLVYKER